MQLDNRSTWKSKARNFRKHKTVHSSMCWSPLLLKDQYDSPPRLSSAACGDDDLEIIKNIYKLFPADKYMNERIEEHKDKLKIDK